MAIEKRPTKNGTTYRAVIVQRFNGKRHRFTESFKTRKEARNWEIEQLESLKSGLNVVDMHTNFQLLVDKWLSEVIIHEKSYNTYRAIRADMTVHILPVLGTLKISKISKNHISNMRAQLSEKKLSRSSINRIMASFKSFVKYTIDHGYIIKNPFVGYKELKVQKKQKDFWEKDDLKKFVAGAKGDFYYDLYMFALNTGLRIGELAALDVGKVNFARNTILVDESIGRNGAGSVKNYEIRNIYMNEIVRNIAKNRVEGKRPTEPLFTTREGHRLYSSAFSLRYFKPIQHQLGLESIISFHGLRHTFASHFLMNGGSIFDLQKLLGHKSINSTMVYAHLSQSHINEIMENIYFG